MSKLKFEYYYLAEPTAEIKPNTLFVQKPLQPRQSITKTFTTNWNSPGFILEPASHWITFTHYPNKITAFYKEVQIPSQESLWELEKITYYQKDLPKISPITFTFEKSDQVQKIDGVWVKKHPTK